MQYQNQTASATVAATSSRTFRSFDPPLHAVSSLVRLGSIFAAAAQATRMVTQMLSVIFLSRLLDPGDFGVAAMCAPVFSFVGMFLDLGFGQVTIQRKHITEDEVNYLFWLNILAGLVIAMILVLLAPAVAAFYRDARPGPVIAATGIPIVITSLAMQQLALLNRHMKFGLLALIEISSAVLSLAAALGWAMFMPSYWAIYVSSIVGAATPALGAWMASDWRPTRPQLNYDGRSLVNFGLGVTGFNIASFVSRNADNILIARRWGNVELGLYDRAYKLLLFPLNQVAAPMSRVLSPALSRLTDDPEAYKRMFLTTVAATCLAALPGIAFATAEARPLISVLLGSKWTGSALIFQVLGFAALLQTLNNFAGLLLITQGHSRDYMFLGIFVSAVCLTSFILGLPFGGIGVATAYTLGEYIITPIIWIYVSRSGVVHIYDIIDEIGPLLLGSFCSVVGCLSLGPLFASPGLVPFAALLVFSYMCTGIIAMCFASSRLMLFRVVRLATRF